MWVGRLGWRPHRLHRAPSTACVCAAYGASFWLSGFKSLSTMGLKQTTWHRHDEVASSSSRACRWLGKLARVDWLAERGRQLSRPPYKIHFHFSYHDAPRPHGVLRSPTAACACPMDSIAPLPGIGRPKFNLHTCGIAFPVHSSAGSCQPRRHFCCAIAWRRK